MIEAPQITRLEAAPTAVIRLTIPREKMPEVMGPAIQEILNTLAAQSIQPTGAVFAHHFAMDPRTFDFEVGVPVARPVTVAGRVEPGERPNARVAQTIYHGPYEGLPDAWSKFHAWIEENGHDFASDVWETYLDGPHSNPDPAKWRTELSRPLRHAAA